MSQPLTQKPLDHAVVLAFCIKALDQSETLAPEVKRTVQQLVRYVQGYQDRITAVEEYLTAQLGAMNKAADHLQLPFPMEPPNG